MKKILEGLRSLADKFKQADNSETKYKRNVFKQEYKIFTGSYRKAVILDHLLFNYNLTPWVRKSAKQLTEELCFDCHPRTVARDLQDLVKDGLLLKRDHVNPWIKDKQYQPQVGVIIECLEQIAFNDSGCHSTECPIGETQDPSEVHAGSTQKQKHSKPFVKQTTRDAVALSPAEIEDLAIANKQLLDRMISEVTNLNHKPAIALISKFGREAVENQLNWLPARKANNPDAILTQALKEDWAAPAEVIKAQEASETREQNAMQENQAQGVISLITKGQMFRIGETVLEYVRAVGSSVIVALNGQETILPRARMSEAVLL